MAGLNHRFVKELTEEDSMLQIRECRCNKVRHINKRRRVPGPASAWTGFFFRALLCAFVAIPLSQFPAIAQHFKDPNLLAAEDYLKKGNYQKAADAAELALSLDPKIDPDAYLIMAVARVNLHQYPQAVETLENGLQLFPNAMRLQQHYVALLQRVKLPSQDARQKLEKQLQISPSSRIFQKALGEVLMKENSLSKQAGQLLAGVAQASPRDPEARYLYGQWLCANNKSSQCLTEMQQALEFTPSANAAARMQILLTLAGAEKQLNHPTRAESAYRSALEINRRQPSPNPAVTYLYVKFLLDHSREEETRLLVEEILHQAPNFGPARLQQARFLSKGGKLDEALTEGLEALKDPNNDPDDLRAIHAFLAKTYFALGKIEEAKVHQEWLKANQK